jgi:hypothetical protein
MGEDQVALPLRHLLQAVTAGHADAVGHLVFDGVVVGIAARGADRGDLGGGKSGEGNGHGGSPLFGAVAQPVASSDPELAN